MRTPRVAVRLAARLDDALTVRQQEVFDLVAAGQSFGTIAQLLKISKPTAWQHYRYARAKLAQQSLRKQGLLANPNGNGRRR